MILQAQITIVTLDYLVYLRSAYLISRPMEVITLYIMLTKLSYIKKKLKLITAQNLCCTPW